jgi:gliding motility-associated-like protein
LDQFRTITVMRTSINLLLGLALLFSPALATGQAQNNQWRFGFGSAIDFNTSPPSFPTGAVLPSSALVVGGGTIQGSASIADRTTGALLFYTDGEQVWNALDQPMPNGAGLLGGRYGGGTTAAIIVPKPGSCSQYYIFCVGDDENDQTDGLTYSLVDMTLDNGLGDIDSAQKNILLLVNLSEWMHAYPKASGDGYWVLTGGGISNYPNQSGEVAAFDVTAAGVDPTPVMSPVPGTAITTIPYFNAKVNPQGTKFVLSGGLFYLQDGIEMFAYTNELYDFNANTGQLTNPIRLRVPDNISNNGGTRYYEFSPDGTKLYAAGGALLQYDISSNDSATIAASATQVVFPPDGQGAFGTPQLGPNNKLYIPVEIGNNESYIWEIDDPNAPVGQFAPPTQLPASVRASRCLPQWIYDLDPTLNDVQSTVGAITCAGADDGSIEVVPSGVGDFNFTWNTVPVQTIPALSDLGPGDYSVTIVSEGGCDTTITFSLVEPAPLEILLEEELLACQDRPLTISVGSSGGTGEVTFDWSNQGVGSSITIIPEVETEFTVTATDSNGCATSGTTRVRLEEPLSVYFPNTFTPNGDGINDDLGASLFPVPAEFELVIFDRWGGEVFRSTDPGERWTAEGYPNDLYAYKLSTADRCVTEKVRTVRGHVTVLR